MSTINRLARTFALLGKVENEYVEMRLNQIDTAGLGMTLSPAQIKKKRLGRAMKSPP